jgi:hypothetical protein
MIVGCMQPYFFPYLGYFQLMASCEQFVLLDDTQFVKSSWIHRNRILLDGAPRWLSMPVVAADRFLPIMRREYTRNPENESALFRRLQFAYATAPHRTTTFALLDRIFACEETSVGAFNANLLRVLAREFELACRIRLSSEEPKDHSLRGQDRILAICAAISATRYVNAPGGRALYDAQAFQSRGIALEFLEPRIEPYAQGGAPFVGSLSIIDVLMFNGLARTTEMIRAGSR